MGDRRDRDDPERTQADPVRTQLGVSAKPQASREIPLVDTVVLQRYLVEHKLGSGAMGSVHRGVDVNTHRPVAIKILHKHLGHDPIVLRRFRRESKAAARMSHENVVGVIDVGVHEGSPVLVLELADGPSLRELLTRPLTAQRTTRLTAGILRGLEHAHRAGLIHRDLKPENVIVEYRADGSEVPRIVDFGIAVLRDPDGDTHSSKLTAEGIVVGTPQYMAPEQAMGEAIDHRVDLFALGVAVYEMLAGVAPFTGSAQKVVLANVGQDPPPIEERAPRVGADPLLELFARKLMARSLATRFESAHDALRTLELVERDPEAAALALGKTDVSKASALIALPPLPDEDE